MAHQNQLLASLPPAVLDAVKPFFKVRDLPFGTVLTETQGLIEDVFFPHIGVVSLVVELKDGDMLETAMVGRDGAVGAASALDGKVSLNKAIVQLAGVASVLKTDKLRELANSYEGFRSLLIRHEQVLFATAQQAAACNASHLVEAKPGDRIIYYRGHLAFDRTPSAHVLDGPSRAIVPVVANRVMALAEKGLVLPVQKRIGSNDCFYIAVKALPSRVASHRVDAPSQLQTGSETTVAMPAHPAPAPLAA